MHLKFLNRKGFSLPEIMIALGLLGGVSLVTMKLVEDQMGNEAYLKGQTEINKAVALIETNINNKIRCEQMIGGGLINQNLSSLRIVADPAIPTYRQLLAVGDYPHFSVNAIAIRSSTFNSTTEVGGTANVIDLSIDFSIKRRALLTRTDTNNIVINKRIPIVVKITGSAIVSCGPALSDSNNSAQEAFCRSIPNATWIRDTVEGGTQGRCELANTMKCPWGQIPIQFLSIGNIDCAPIEKQLKLDELFYISPTGENCANKAIQLTVVGNQLRLVCP